MSRRRKSPSQKLVQPRIQRHGVVHRVGAGHFPDLLRFLLPAARAQSLAGSKAVNVLPEISDDHLVEFVVQDGEEG